MKVQRLRLRNYRGIQEGTVFLDGHSLLVGSNSVGKSTICEALDLVLGPERMFRRPVIDEFDFFGARYQERDGILPEVRIELVLTGLSEAAERRFGGHLRPWSATANDFLDQEPGAIDKLDDAEWCLPLLFIGRFNPAEDDFEGATLFAHPEPAGDDFTEGPAMLGAGLNTFSRDDKRHCGFLYLRPNRTGSRALTFQRGSLLDTIVRLESELAGPLWENALSDLAQVVIATDDSAFSKMRTEVHERVGRFLHLADVSDPVDIRASELTREHLREMLRLFIATQPGVDGVPFNRLSTGSLNLLVFSLLTYIAELKGDHAVIFAMEEPEIALPPHAQRRLIDFVTQRMGQAIVTSHSPYVIEKFDPAHVVVLDRDASGILTSARVDLPHDFKLKRYRANRRQFAEAVLANAVIVVEGATEAAVLPVVADVLDQDPSVEYIHLDLAGVSIFDAQNDVSVPLYAPIFKKLGKTVFGLHDRPATPFPPALDAKTADFSIYEVIPYGGIEDLLVAEVPADVQRRFLSAVSTRSDYPNACGSPTSTASGDDIRSITRSVLKVRKGSGSGYAALLVAECNGVDDLPATLTTFLLKVEAELHPAFPRPAAEDDSGGDPGD
ncbi:MAG: ATP-dependent nuclease [Acidimicrobiales bacterium]